MAQILAEPNLIVVEGSEASFLAGGEFPYPTITSTPTTGAIAPVVTVQFKKFGVQLNFTPNRDRVRRDQSQSEARGQRARLHQRRDGRWRSDSRDFLARGRDRSRC